MATEREKLTAKLETQELILEAASNRLLALLGRNIKEYEYSNTETKHISKIQDIDKVQAIIDGAEDYITRLTNKLRPTILYAKNIC